jgi:hypothetical protein
LPAAEVTSPGPAEERSYLAFAAVALALTLTAGLTLGILIAFGEAGVPPLAARLPRLVQAHGWTQLQGWIGLLVAGMALRLVPRLTGRRPLPSWLTASVLILLGCGVLLRVLAQAGLDGPLAGALLSAAGLISAAGAALLAGGLAIALLSRGRSWQAWRLAAWSGTFWWIVWAVLTATGGLLQRDGLVPDRLDEATVWVGLLGALSNFAWAVQGRSVPVFYGRLPPGAVRLVPPLLMLNLGVALAALSSISGSFLNAGLGLAGLGTAWLAPVAGSVQGAATRLRPGSRPAARFILAANLWAVAAGVLLLAATASTVARLGRADALRDAALHAAGLGFLTTLILGMGQLLMPAFAGERALAGSRGPESWLSWPAIMLATLLRVLGAVLTGPPRAALIASSGVLAWIGLAAFATGLLRAARSWPAAKGRRALP